MSRLRTFIRKSRGTVGLQVALAMLFPAKSKAGTAGNNQPEKSAEPANPEAKSEAPPHLTGRWDFGRLFEVAAHPEIVKDARQSAERAQSLAKNAVHLAAKAASASQAKPLAQQGAGFNAPPMTHEEVRLWLQSFNAGPYACLKYRGDVPYQETMNYVPRVLKNYETITHTPYDNAINAAAAKYGLDPQMIRAIMKTESDFDNTCVSPAGARGLMQVMPVVWSEIQEKYGFGWDYTTGVFEPEKNIEVACAYLAWLRYDFLPRHFDAYDRRPDAPTILVRDSSRGVPDRVSPRIIARSAGGPDVARVEVASADEKPKLPESSIKVESAKTEKPSIAKADKPAEHDSNGEADKKVSAKAKPRVEIADAGSDKVIKKSTSNGKTRVVVRGNGNGKAVTLAVKNSKVVTPVEKLNDDDEKVLKSSKRPSLAKADSKKKSTDETGG